MTTQECEAFVNQAIAFDYVDEKNQKTSREVIVKEVKEKTGTGLPYMVCFDGLRSEYRTFYANRIQNLRML